MILKSIDLHLKSSVMVIHRKYNEIPIPLSVSQISQLEFVPNLAWPGDWGTATYCKQQKKLA